MAKHALLSASSADRWLHCPPSARLCEGYEDKGSDYAAEGTDAHTLCESRLKQALGMKTKDPVEDLSWYNTEMEDCASGYTDYVLELLGTGKTDLLRPGGYDRTACRFQPLGQRGLRHGRLYCYCRRHDEHRGL